MDLPLYITVLGSGTSTGVPTIGCECAVCTSTDPRDNRLRPSILVRYAGKGILIDTTPDFRTQALRAQIERVDAILYTHAHADHILGLDDVRPFNYRQRAEIPIYAKQETLDAIRRVFQYAFEPEPARRLVRRLEFCHTPKHGSWLNIAENELSAMTRQCVTGRRFETIDLLREETTAWHEYTNEQQRGVDWQFKVDDARVKLRSVYPKLQV